MKRETAIEKKVNELTKTVIDDWFPALSFEKGKSPKLSHLQFLTQITYNYSIRAQNPKKDKYYSWDF